MPSPILDLPSNVPTPEDSVTRHGGLAQCNIGTGFSMRLNGVHGFSGAAFAAQLLLRDLEYAVNDVAIQEQQASQAERF